MKRSYPTVRPLPGVLLLLCLLPLPVAAAGEGWGMIETAGRLFNLAILFGALIYFTRQPLAVFFDGQRKKIQQELQQAQEAQQMAESELAAVQEKMSNLDEELTALGQQAAQEAERESERIRTEAEAEAARIVETAEREIAGLSHAARHRLREYAAELALELATRQARDSMNEESDAQLIDRFLREFEGERSNKVQ